MHSFHVKLMSNLCGWVLLAVRLFDNSGRHGVVFKTVRGSRTSHSLLSSCLGERAKRHTVNGFPRKTIAHCKALSWSRLVNARMNLIQSP
jgi:hypothetical protein